MVSVLLGLAPFAHTNVIQIEKIFLSASNNATAFSYDEEATQVDVKFLHLFFDFRFPIAPPNPCLSRLMTRRITKQVTLFVYALLITRKSVHIVTSWM